jgi:RNA processing factor Prp31
VHVRRSIGFWEANTCVDVCIPSNPHLCTIQLTHLIDGLDQEQLNAMVLGLGHSLSRYKLKFSPDKVDTMIVQAIGLLDDLDKEINTYAMRVKEWYGWHFPEMAKIVADNLQYAKVRVPRSVDSCATCGIAGDLSP